NKKIDKEKSFLDKVFFHEAILKCLTKIKGDFSEICYNLKNLQERLDGFLKEDMTEKERLEVLIQSAVELTSKEAPKWEFIAGRLLYCKFKIELEEKMKALTI